jgi:hypothetical protein
MAPNSIKIISLNLNKVDKSLLLIYISIIRFSRGEEAINSFFIFREVLSIVVNPIFRVDVIISIDIKRTRVGFVFRVRLR